LPLLDLVVKNAKVWTQNGLIKGGIGVREDKICTIANDYGLPAADKLIDAHGNLVIPGFVDEHVHFRDPYEGPRGDIATMREDFATGTMAAAAGGVTTIIEMPDSFPLVVNAEAARAKLEVCRRKAYVDFGLHGGFMPGTDYTREIVNLYRLGLTGLKTYTCSFFSMPEWPACYDGDLYNALTVIGEIGAIALLHAENEFILSYNEKRLRDEGRTDLKAHLEWRTPLSEIEADRRMIYFLKQTRARGLLVHTSVPEGVLETRTAREQGYEIYVETCPHFLFLTDEDLIRKGVWAKTAPPLRNRERVDEMWRLLNLGYVDTLGSDHTPYTKEEKIAAMQKPVWDAGNGVSSIEASLPLMMDAVNKHRTSLERVLEIACSNPAKLFGLYPRKGTLTVGADADFVIVDMKSKHKISNDSTKSKCGWTLYDGMITDGEPKMTFVRGSMIMQDGEIVGKEGFGQFVTRIDRESEVAT